MTHRKAALFHGLGGSEKSFWIPWLKAELEQEGFDVWTPSLAPCEGFDDLDKWVREVVERSVCRDFDLMVGHSAGGPLILRLLSRGDFSAQHIISVAGFIKPLTDGDEDEDGDGNGNGHMNDPAYPADFDVAAIRQGCRALTFIHADNDPWDCGQDQGEFMRKTLGGTLVVMTGEGHFGSEAMKQPYKSFPLLLSHCLLSA